MENKNQTFTEYLKALNELIESLDKIFNLALSILKEEKKENGK